MAILVARLALLEGVFVDPLHGGCHRACLYHDLASRSTRLGTLMRPSLPLVSPSRGGQNRGFSKNGIPRRLNYPQATGTRPAARTRIRAVARPSQDRSWPQARLALSS